MARGRRDGILIAGGGLAGCLAALAMARFRPEVPLLIVEERETFGGEGYRLFADAELDEDGARPARARWSSSAGRASTSPSPASAAS